MARHRHHNAPSRAADRRHAPSALSPLNSSAAWPLLCLSWGASRPSRARASLRYGRHAAQRRRDRSRWLPDRTDSEFGPACLSPQSGHDGLGVRSLSSSCYGGRGARRSWARAANAGLRLSHHNAGRAGGTSLYGRPAGRPAASCHDSHTLQLSSSASLGGSLLIPLAARPPSSRGSAGGREGRALSRRAGLHAGRRRCCAAGPPARADSDEVLSCRLPQLVDVLELNLKSWSLGE